MPPLSLPPRLLVTGGTFLVISLGAPTGRLDIFSKAGLNWDVEVVLMPKPILYLKSESSLTGQRCSRMMESYPERILNNVHAP